MCQTGIHQLVEQHRLRVVEEVVDIIMTMGEELLVVLEKVEVL
jgi:hypothetical protein